MHLESTVRMHVWYATAVWNALIYIQEILSIVYSELGDDGSQMTGQLVVTLVYIVALLEDFAWLSWFLETKGSKAVQLHILCFKQ